MLKRKISEKKEITKSIISSFNKGNKSATIIPRGFPLKFKIYVIESKIEIDTSKSD